MKPVIGITPSMGTFENRGDIFRMEVSYVEAVEAAGGVPVLLPPSAAGVEELIGVVDGIIFSDGADIRPDRYGEFLLAMRERDRLDMTRADSPLVRAEDAILVEADGLDVAGVVRVMLGRVKARARA